MSQTTPPIAMTESAAKRIRFLLEREGEAGSRLRVAVSGGGCSGFQYGFSIDDEIKDDDVIIERDGASVVIDSVSLLYLANAEIDFIEELAGSYFTIRNPNATSSCGCGNSFALA